MARKTWVLAMLGAAAAVLAACDSGGGGGGGGGAAQDNFGAAFAAVFNAAATADPGNPAAGDVPAISLTADPIDI